MEGLTLVIGNQNYSSWSMRPWVLMKQLGIAFEEKKLRFHSAEWDAQIERWSPSRLVPVLWRGDQAVCDRIREPKPGDTASIDAVTAFASASRRAASQAAPSPSRYGAY